jgi:hypothetical protein
MLSRAHRLPQIDTPAKLARVKLELFARAVCLDVVYLNANAPEAASANEATSVCARLMNGCG